MSCPVWLGSTISIVMSTRKTRWRRASRRIHTQHQLLVALERIRGDAVSCAHFPPRLTEGVPVGAACLCVAVYRDGWCGFCLKHLLHGLPAGQQLPFGEVFVRGRAYLCVNVAEQDFRDCCCRCHAAQWQEAVGGYGEDYGRVRLDR